MRQWQRQRQLAAAARKQKVARKQVQKTSVKQSQAAAGHLSAVASTTHAHSTHSHTYTLTHRHTYVCLKICASQLARNWDPFIKGESNFYGKFHKHFTTFCVLFWCFVFFFFGSLSFHLHSARAKHTLLLCGIAAAMESSPAIFSAFFWIFLLFVATLWFCSAPDVTFRCCCATNTG